MKFKLFSESPLIVFILLPELSAFNSSFALARRLRTRGFRILYGGPQNFQEHVLAQGFSYELLEISKPDFAKQENQLGSLRRWSLRRRQIRYYRRESRLMLDRCVASFQQMNPALVLLDPLFWPYAELPLRCGVPIVAFNTSFASSFNPQVPPAFCGLMPGNPRLGRVRLRNGLAWGRRILTVGSRLWYFEKIVPLLHGLLPGHSAIQRIERLGGRLCWSEYGPRLVLPELVVAPRELDLPQLVASNDRTYIGACVDLARKDGDFDWGDLDPQRPLLYCSLGTYSHVYPHARRLFSAVVDVLRRRPDLQGIVQVGTAAETDNFGPLPTNIRILKHAPQIEVLARASLFITHGGLSSVRESLQFGVPMIVFPCWMEQPGNAVRVVHHGLGLRGNIAQVTFDQLLALIERVEQGDFQPALRRMKAIFEAQSGCQAGVDFIEAFLDRQKAQRPLKAAIRPLSGSSAELV
ncbi:nucleotide disphospho-sugar-binding domain-containing protein [Azotobacter vinelandii]|uniref:nucleotide disphospho-sugar-binding domain-containing protein n=1 Tax=Azotobacter vinelandii TaxID=354 RepID=UPI0026671A53|nr:glycosyltransferase [Azotobacter vinelandii]WKN24380.1 glycosyltransferase [Azotobacter vinelandii]